MMGAGAANAATVVFSDNFDDNDVSDWAFSTNYSAGTSGLESGVVDGDPTTEAEKVLGAFINAPPGGSNLVARASKTLTLLGGSYSLKLDALSVPCSGCTISYDVLFDGGSVARVASNGVWNRGVTFNLGSISGGDHTLVLGMHTTNASSGHFLAQFDNVELSGDNLVTGGVPEPATWAMMIIGVGAAGTMIRRRKSVIA